MAPQEESKIVEDPVPAPAPVEEDSEDSGEDVEADPKAPADSKSVSKKKSKKKNKGKQVATGDGDSAEQSGKKLPKAMVNDILKHNPALASEFQGMEKGKVEDVVRAMKLDEILTGLATGGKNQKDMASYKFWATQPVQRFDEQDLTQPDGIIRQQNLEDVPAEGAQLLEGFEWVTMDLADDNQMNEVYELLTNHYVEDQEAKFRFNYSASFLNWALKSPGWLKEWHVGVRVTASRKLVAFISGIPVNLKVRENTVACSEINFLCIHKKLRSKRLAPVLIKEITRRCNLEQIWSAIYTAGVVLPKPVGTCRYFHRSINWLKLYEVGFSPLPPQSTKTRQITKYHLQNQTKTTGLREMEIKDVEQVHGLLTRYLERFDIAPQYNKEEIEHWFVFKPETGKERAIWTYVVEDAQHNITDMFSFYALESSVIGNKKHEVIRAAYLFYYATETAFTGSTKDLKARLNGLINDALILAKKYNFDVFNALTLLDNVHFLQEQKFGAGDGQLHYYLFNWRTPFIHGGIDDKGAIDEKNGSGVGMVML